MEKSDTKRRDQVMLNTLSVQYNPMIEQEWDEHFRVSCEYGSDFWKTISFSPFNVETNTGAPVVFTIDPPQCQMEILKGHGVVGPRQESVSGPVTVGDPLTLLIHMKSERSGYDILVKNCIAHNGSNQKIQLIDSNGCVVNERFISPFRGSYNDNNLRHVTLYSYLKAFRFTGSPVLYLECEIHMCQSACPPQMCYWRRLSKRSSNSTQFVAEEESLEKLPYYLSPESSAQTLGDESTTKLSLVRQNSKRQSRGLDLKKDLSAAAGASSKLQLSDSLNLIQALEVRQEREPEVAAFNSLSDSFVDDADSDNDGKDDNIIPTAGVDQRTLNRALSSRASKLSAAKSEEQSFKSDDSNTSCYTRGAVHAYLAALMSLFLVTISVTIGCLWQARRMRTFLRKQASMSAACLQADQCAAARKNSQTSANNNTSRVDRTQTKDDPFEQQTAASQSPHFVRLLAGDGSPPKHYLYSISATDQQPTNQQLEQTN